MGFGGLDVLANFIGVMVPSRNGEGRGELEHSQSA